MNFEHLCAYMQTHTLTEATSTNCSPLTLTWNSFIHWNSTELSGYTHTHTHIHSRKVSTIKSQSASCFYCLIRLFFFLRTFKTTLASECGTIVFYFFISLLLAFSIVFVHTDLTVKRFCCSFTLFYSILFAYSFSKFISLFLSFVFFFFWFFTLPFFISLLLSSHQFSLSTFDNFDARNLLLLLLVLFF